MPNMANITVKAANGSTDVIFTSLVASAGDKSEAQWRVTAAGASPSLQPYLRVRSQYNGARTVRRVEGSFGYHETITDSTTTLTSVKASALGSFSISVPMVLSTTAADEAAALFGNLLASALMKSVNSTGYAPT